MRKRTGSGSPDKMHIAQLKLLKLTAPSEEPEGNLDGNILYLAYDDGYTTIYVCPNSWNCELY